MKYSRLLGLLALVLFCAGGTAFGQSDRGSITGTVTDPSGAVIEGAKVTATNVDSNEVREAETNGAGQYSLPQLQAATWRISVEAPGFKTSTVDDVKVAVQVTRTAD